MNNKIFVGVLVIAGLFIFVSNRTDNFYQSPQNKNVVDEQYPDVENAEEIIYSKKNLIRVENPVPGQIVDNPIFVKGQVRGFWFFEGSFPLVVVDWDGRIIGQGFATAQGEWMTEEFVSFTGEVTYNLPNDSPYNDGAIIFRKDNPSGLPENDDALEIPVLFE